MAKQNYDVLEEQIGDAGVEQEHTLGHLKYAESYGGKRDLTDREQKEMDAFLERSNKHKKQPREEDNLITNGWIQIDRNELGVRSLFYPKDWNFYIRPATVQAIKNWTSIDEERADVLNNVFNDIIKTCVKIDTTSNIGTSWSQIRSWDRFWFILKVREYTYSQGQSKIEFDDECSECGTEITYTLNSQSLFYEFPDEDLVDKYWDGNTWNINPREYDVDHDSITLYTPTLGKDEAIIEWATSQVRAKKKIDETFIKFLVWLLPKAPKDEQLLDRQIQKIYKEYKDWDINMFTFMNDVINNITINPSEQLKIKCPNCGMEATSAVQFPNGIKFLFQAQTTAKKFGSR